MNMIQNAIGLIHSIADSIEAARLTSGRNAMSSERLAQARRLVLDAGVETSRRQADQGSASISEAARQAA